MNEWVNSKHHKIWGLPLKSSQPPYRTMTLCINIVVYLVWEYWRVALQEWVNCLHDKSQFTRWGLSASCHNYFQRATIYCITTSTLGFRMGNKVISQVRLLLLSTPTLREGSHNCGCIIRVGGRKFLPCSHFIGFLIQVPQGGGWWVVVLGLHLN